MQAAAWAVRVRKTVRTRLARRPARSRTAEADPSLCVNDLEPPAFTVLPKLAQMKARMAADAERKYDAVFMSGSGSTLPARLV